MAIPDAAALYRLFDEPTPCTVGIEEEVMLLDGDTLDLLPRAADVVAAADTTSIEPEMRASQLELTTPPADTVGAAIVHLGRARRQLAHAAHGIGLLAVAGVHPFAARRRTANRRTAIRIDSQRIWGNRPPTAGLRPAGSRRNTPGDPRGRRI